MLCSPLGPLLPSLVHCSKLLLRFVPPVHCSKLLLRFVPPVHCSNFGSALFLRFTAQLCGLVGVPSVLARLSVWSVFLQFWLGFRSGRRSFGSGLGFRSGRWTWVGLGGLLIRAWHLDNGLIISGVRGNVQPLFFLQRPPEAPRIPRRAFSGGVLSVNVCTELPEIRWLDSLLHCGYDCHEGSVNMGLLNVCRPRRPPGRRGTFLPKEKRPGRCRNSRGASPIAWGVPDPTGPAVPRPARS